MHAAKFYFPAHLKALTCLAVLLAIQTTASYGQVNIERLRLSELDFMAGSVGGSFSVRAGNVEFYSLGLNGRYDITKGRHDAFLVGRVNLIQDESTVLSYIRFGHLRYNYDIKTWWQLEGFAQGEYDEIRLLNQRLLFGTGFRFKVFKSPNATLHLGTTPMLEIEHLNPSVVGVEQNTQVARWSNYVSWRTSREGFMSLVHTTYVQPQITDFSDLRLLNETSIDFVLFANLSLGIVMNLRYDSNPPPAVKDFDFTLSNTLKYSL